MPAQQEDPEETSIGELFHQLVEEGREVARAEINLYRQIAVYRAQKAQVGAIALGAGAVLSLAAVIVLLVMFAIGLAVYIGPFWAGLVVAGLAGMAGAMLLRFGAMRIGVLFGDQEEQAALRDGEKKA